MLRSRLSVLALVALAGTLAHPAPAQDTSPATAPLPPLVAHWDLDEVFGSVCSDTSGNGYDAAPDRPLGAGVVRVPGVLGNALRLSATHMIRVPGGPDLNGLAAVSFSAWVQPTGFERYTEILRKEDGNDRFLFAFQETGTLLTLGLNVGGYVECDATVDPAVLLDGKWHHCAAVFDGTAMRVYLDGALVGTLERPGKISAGGASACCLGSSNGGECFQGTLDDVRIYNGALSAEQVAGLCQEGLAAAAKPVATVPTSWQGDEPALGVAPLAQWTFNETTAAGTFAEAGGKELLAVASGGALPLMEGIHGGAVALSGTHGLRTAGWPEGTRLEGIAFSAWVAPTDLGGFREIFRKEDGDRRLLFSFQEGGTVLSLGLNIGGYIECDASIAPGAVLDGQWHHCAGTFDGATMRVYLDGRQVGELKRPGEVALAPGTPAFVGSSSGSSEHFQGALDDVRVYGQALSEAEVQQLYAAGRVKVERQLAALEERIGSFLVLGPTFAETLATSRQRMAQGSRALGLDLVGAVAARLRGAFPEDYDRFAALTQSNPLEYVAARNDQYQQAQASRLVDLMMEYRPLTDEQKARTGPEDEAGWAEADRIAQRLAELKRDPEANRYSPEWVRVMMEAGARVQLRPYISEPVAPYVQPETPVTRDLTAAEAADVLRRDWLHQASGNPSPQRILAEIGWTRELVQRLEAGNPGAVDLRSQRAALDGLAERAKALTGPDEGLYLEVRRLKRQVVFANPVVDFDTVVFVDGPYPQGSEWPHETRHRLGYMAVPGGRLLTLKGLGPEGHLTQLMPQGPLHGSFWRPDVSFDGRRVLASFKPHNEKAFHLYEVNADGSGLRQLTDGIYDDLDPIYLADGKHLMFSTTRGHTYVRCMPPTNAFVLARCDADGRNVYLVSSNNEPDYLPSMMSDGRVVYTRWEYTDKPLWRAQKLWTVNPDGTGVATLWGNQSVWPDLMKDARQIPGSRRVMFTGCGHHDWFAGSIGIVDASQGFNYPHGITKVTHEIAWPEVGNAPEDPVESPRYHTEGSYDGYYSPYPLGERDFLVSARRGGKYLLYLMDTDGNREIIYEGVHNVWHAQPLRARPVPPVVPESTVWPTREEADHPREGMLFSANVYQGAPEVLRNKAAFLRVLHIDPKTYTYWNRRPYISTGPVVSMVQSDGVKQVLGTVPIAADGSVSFNAPPGKALHFQLLDADGRALQTMRSFVGVMPGEKRGCQGCHELHSTAAMTGVRGDALARPPSAITPPPWGVDTVSFPRYVQPVLDKHCGSCHQGDGEARKVLDLTRRPGFMDFDEPYVTLTGSPTWAAPYERPKDPPPGWGIANTIMVEGYNTVDPAAYSTPAPMTRLSYASPLIALASSGKHHGVKVDPVSLQRLICWVDTMCPYFGAEEIRELPDPDFQGVDWLSIRPRIATAPSIVRPGPVD